MNTNVIKGLCCAFAGQLIFIAFWLIFPDVVLLLRYVNAWFSLPLLVFAGWLFQWSENVISYYDPLIKPRICGRHYLWSNFNITKKKFDSNPIIERVKIHNDYFGFNIKKYSVEFRKDQILRNLVNPDLGLHIFNCAFKEKQQTLHSVQKVKSKVKT